MALTHTQQAARTLGRLTSPRKAEAARRNGKLGGQTSPAGLGLRAIERAIRAARAEVHLARNGEVFFPARWAYPGHPHSDATTSRHIQAASGTPQAQGLAYAAQSAALSVGVRDYHPDPVLITTVRAHARAIQAELVLQARAEAAYNERAGDVEPEPRWRDD